MVRHRRIDIGDAFHGRRKALEFVAARQLVERTAAEADEIARVRRAAADIYLLEHSPDATPRPWRTGKPVLDECQQAGCHQFAGWFVRCRRGTTSRPTYQRLCTRDAAGELRRRAHTSTTRRDIAR